MSSAVARRVWWDISGRGCRTEGRRIRSGPCEDPPEEGLAMADVVGSSGIPVVVGLPESLDRRMRLGPFPSARHALKFAAYAAVGGSVAAILGVVLTIPLLGGRFL